MAIKIEIIGKTKPSDTSKKLFAMIMGALQELKVEATVDFIADSKRMMALSILQEPIIIAENKIIASGFAPALGSIKNLLLELSRNEDGQFSAARFEGKGICNCSKS